jgi:hypothetical protein
VSAVARQRKLKGTPGASCVSTCCHTGILKVGSIDRLVASHFACVPAPANECVPRPSQVASIVIANGADNIMVR